MYDLMKIVLPDNVKPSKEYFLSDGRTAVLIRTNETATKFTIQPSRVLGIITNDKQITFDIPYLISTQFFNGSTFFYEVE